MAKDTNNLCPIWFIAKNAAEVAAARSKSGRCRTTRCQWWVAAENKCAVLVSAEAQKTIADKP
jgi:hypothetical protein